MDCTNARLLLNFVRTGELDPAEREGLENHLTGCPECAAIAQSEGRLDDVLETAMQRVPIPAGLKGRILQRLASKRRPGPWPWVAAATVLLAAGLGGFVALNSGPVEFDPSLFAVNVSYRTGLRPETVEARFSELNIAMKAPREFNFDLLDNYETAVIQERPVAKLTFLARSGTALLHVYVLPARQFKLPAYLEEAAKNDGDLSEIIPASTHNIQVRRDKDVPDFVYVVVYTSRSLDPFRLPGI